MYTKTLNSWVKRIHMYLGLLNLSILLVFGIAGLKATFSNPRTRQPSQPVVRFENYKAPPSVIDDKELAEQVRQRLDFPAVGVDTRRDRDNNLLISYYTHSGPRRVTVLEKEDRLRIA